MYIRNSNADYSACGLGRVPIIDLEIMGLIADFSNYDTMSFTQKMAFQTLMDDLGYGNSGSVFSKLTALILPSLGESVDDCLIDIISGNKFIPYQKVPSSLYEAQPISSVIAKSGEGMVAISSGIRLTIPSVDFKAMTVFSFAKNTDASTGFGDFAGGSYGNSSSSVIRAQMTDGTSITTFQAPTTSTVYRSMIAIANANTENAGIILPNSSILSANITRTYTATNNIAVLKILGYLATVGDQTGNKTNPILVSGVASGLTIAEGVILNTSINSFLINLGIY